MIYAGFWPRALALLVDLAVWVPLVIVYVAVQGRSIELAMVALLLATGLGVAYPVYFLSRWGQTLGKMVARIKVVRLDAWASEAWMWIIAGTVVVRVHARSSSDRPRFGTAPPGVTLFHACHAWAASQA
jgi:RDD family protein